MFDDKKKQFEKQVELDSEKNLKLLPREINFLVNGLQR